VVEPRKLSEKNFVDPSTGCVHLRITIPDPPEPEDGLDTEGEEKSPPPPPPVFAKPS
jgi:hypothetical protein